MGHAPAAANGGSTSAKLAERARDRYLGPVVTFGERVSYNPPKVGGQPGFSLAVPSGAAPTTPSAPGPAKPHGLQPVIPATLASLAGKAVAGEGQWRVLEKAKGSPRYPYAARSRWSAHCPRRHR